MLAVPDISCKGTIGQTDGPGWRRVLTLHPEELVWGVWKCFKWEDLKGTRVLRLPQSAGFIPGNLRGKERTNG